MRKPPAHTGAMKYVSDRDTVFSPNNNHRRGQRRAVKQNQIPEATRRQTEGESGRIRRRPDRHNPHGGNLKCVSGGAGFTEAGQICHRSADCACESPVASC